MTKIEDFASVHLGKAGDGTVVKPYVTPDNIDNTLLVGVPRYLNREQYLIQEDNLPFVGYDTWNCYEFSTLTTNGFPVCGVIRLVYPSNSKNIVESKSLKLYMNSFNMARLADTPNKAIELSVDIIQRDVGKVLGLKSINDLSVSFCDEYTLVMHPVEAHRFKSIEGSVKVESIKFDNFNEDPSILCVVDSERDRYSWRSAVLRSNCRVTNQPDWGDVFIHIEGSKTVTPESLLQYIVSMRKENHFHEEICECIYKRFLDVLKPDKLLVTCLYTRRGGIDINPIRANNKELIDQYASGLIQSSISNFKTLRQ